jgi:CBS domain-containing protein
VKTRLVKDLMIPLEEYVVVSKDATLYEAVMALEKALRDFDKNRYPHRAILICDENNDIVGKVSQLDILRGLEPKYEQISTKGDSMKRLGFSRNFQRAILDRFKLWDMPLYDVCKKAGVKKVKEFMYSPEDGEYVDVNTTLNEAIHQLVMGHHQSLLVTENKKIVGILRLTDVFMGVFEMISTCSLK